MKAIDTRTILNAAFFTVAPALLASSTPTLALACLPLLASLFALRRGHSWGAFALLGGATCLATMGITEILPWPAALASGGAFLSCGVVVPHLWRFDKVATSIVIAITIVFGTAAGALVEKARPRATVSCDVGAEVPALQPSLHPALHGDLELADLVGVYRLQTNSSTAVLILNAIGGASLEDGKTENGKTLDGRFISGKEGRIEIKFGEETTHFRIGDGVLVGPQGQTYRRMGAEQ